jgi:GNAT superfamily N-acetyltransferase
VDDVAEIRALIHELATYERAADQARATEDQLRDALFGPHPAASALIAADDHTAGTVGFALWFPRFSTWTGTRGMHLEDLYVRPHARGGGHGRALLAALAAICESNGYERFEWQVLDWNEPAIEFYRALGAEFLDEWRICRLTGNPLRTLAGTTPTRSDPSPHGPTPSAAVTPPRVRR